MRRSLRPQVPAQRWGAEPSGTVSAHHLLSPWLMAAAKSCRHRSFGVFQPPHFAASTATRHSTGVGA
jgi:hypothetical protein